MKRDTGLPWQEREKQILVNKAKRVERIIPVNTIDTIKKEQTSKMSNERILDLVKGLELASETSVDASIQDDSAASIYQPLETRLEHVLGSD